LRKNAGKKLKCRVIRFETGLPVLLFFILYWHSIAGGSSVKRIYLDYASTTPIAPEVAVVMQPYLHEVFGNPANAHYFGREAKKAVEHARESVARLVGARPHEIVFTSGGTESNNAALKGIAHANRSRGNHIITSSIEHHSVLAACEFMETTGCNVTYLPVTTDGTVDPEDVLNAITSGTVLISVMHANNEIGTMQAIDEIGKIAREKNVTFHTDAVQTIGHIPVNVDALNVDMLSASAHKFYGPKGVGFLYIRSGTRFSPFMHGGTQEKSRRASTLNVPGIAGMGKAAELCVENITDEMNRMIVLRDKLIMSISNGIKGSRLNGSPSLRLPGNMNVSFANMEGELLLQQLDEEGIACSSGSACSADSLGPSHVLTAIGLPSNLVTGSLRISLGKYVKEEDVDYFLEVLPRAVKKVRSMIEAVD
jgi:cysteine desulfurase